MTTSNVPTGPGPETITDYISTTFPDADVVTMDGACFFSLDAEKHWPNFATIVWTDESPRPARRPARPARPVRGA